MASGGERPELAFFSVDTLALPVPVSREAAHEEYERWFRRTAEILLGDVLLIVAGKPHRLLEVEFYLRDPEGGYDDPFAHGDRQQGNRGEWYFHKVGTGYRGGTRKGVDLTFGSTAPRERRGGVLIRSICDVESNMVIEGPSLVVDHLLKGCGAVSVRSLVEGALGGVPDAMGAGKLLRLESRSCPIFSSTPAAMPEPPPKKRKLCNSFDAAVEVYSSPRVGLILRHSGDTNVLRNQCTYFTKRCRFFTDPLQLRKTPALNVIGVLESLSRKSAPIDSALVELACKACAVKAGIVERCMDLPKMSADECYRYLISGTSGGKTISSTTVKGATAILIMDRWLHCT